MKEKGIGQYDLEYKNCPCFWGNNPGKFVKRAIEYVQSHGKDVLDLGAGEGKNAIFLAQEGFFVDAIEISGYAIKNFNEQLKSLDRSVSSKITVIKEDVTKLNSVKLYDMIVAYGLLHCLASLEEVEKVINFMKISLKSNGIIVVVSFNNQIKVPDVQDYLEPTLLPSNYLLSAFNDWLVLDYENDIITETHPTSQIEHQHSLTRIIAKRINK